MGPLAGIRVIEFAGIGPGPMCAMMLADAGAEVLRIDRRNPALVYGRLTGWGQTGPLAHSAGHDLDYIAIIGALHAIGRAGAPPTPPLNLVGDYGGGGMLLAFGLVAALLHARATGEGQVVDAAMSEGAALLMASLYGMHGAGLHSDERGTNLLDSGAPFYDVYACADGRYVAVAAIEPKFRRILLDRLGIDPATVPDGDDPADWPALRARLADAFRTRSRDAWAALFEGSDACVAPVLSMAEAPHHPHNVARGAFATIDGVVQPAPAPRFGATPGGIAGPPEAPGASTREALADWGIPATRIAALARSGAIGP